MNRNQSLPAAKRAGCVALITLFACAVSAAETTPLPPLSTVPRSPRLPGKFVWADLVTDNVPAAQAFYSQLLGWTFRDLGNYVIAANDERPLCGMVQRPRPANQPKARPRWIGYVSVGNVERAQHAVTKAGGRVLAAPQKFPERGEQAVFADPEGAIFGVVKSSSGDPQDFLPDPGDWIWIQLLSRDGKKASAFYSGLAGYQVVENAETNRLSDYVLVSDGYARATVRTIQRAGEQVQPSWLPFVRVKNLGESVAQTRQLGGKVLIEPRPELFDGKMALIADPTGAALGLLQWSQESMKGAR
jgi:predicted enzyme related to lactoylglutathione lyase